MLDIFRICLVSDLKSVARCGNGKHLEMICSTVCLI